MLTTVKTLGDRIRELRERKKMSLREFSRALDGASAAHVSDIEHSRRFPSPLLLRSMARVLGVEVSDLEKYDIRPSFGDLRRIANRDPLLGVALRTIAEKEISAEEILALGKGKPKRSGI